MTLTGCADTPYGLRKPWHRRKSSTKPEFPRLGFRRVSKKTVSYPIYTMNVPIYRVLKNGCSLTLPAELEFDFKPFLSLCHLVLHQFKMFEYPAPHRLFDIAMCG